MAKPAESRTRNGQTPKRRLIADRAARWVVSAGGIAIIASILGILIFIVLEVLPLAYPPKVSPARRVRIAGAGAIGAVVADEHRSHVAVLDDRGQVRVVRLDDGKVVYAADLLAGPGGGEKDAVSRPAGVGAQRAAPSTLVGAILPPESRALAAATSDGRVILKSMGFSVTFDGQKRVVTPDDTPPIALELDPQHGALGAFAAQLGDDGATVAAVLANGRLGVVRRAVETNEITGEMTESLSRAEVEAPGQITALVMDPDQRNLYGGTAGGEVLWWPLLEGQPGELRTANAGAPVTAVNLLLGGRSLVVGQRNGALSVWFAVEQSDESKKLERIRDFPRLPGAVVRVAPSQRDKGFVALGGGRMGLYYSTSARTLWTGPAPVRGGTAVFYAPKADGAFVGGAGEVAEIAIHNPHPEVTPKALFGKVWYEGAGKPEYVWQSTGGTDDFEPKLSLTPLLAGTLKGTFYSLLLAIPLGVFGAMYTSQFMHPIYKRYLKPMIEIMASLPSVVLGFLAGLWLAPRVEKAVPALALMLIVLPVLILLAGWLWNRLPRPFRGRFPVGTEAILFVFVLAAGIGLCFQLSSPFERFAFGGDFQAWLLRVTGLGYDQRNAVVVGLAMGFAVIPIIFAIAEDAFSNVPGNLVAGSLALGADRWQTVTRVVLPTASPGIFSAIMIGFGRAVGETMIVLMATGNTPIMSWNPFNGFRTLSANIAVEIPEAPHAGTLYRTLFLAALLLFIMTFIVNTVAELVRQRLRERFSHL
ncbi:MAG TPA: ABC transporter permease subunit [Thermoanaerobaculia bacterium]|jgi:phosphate transport system permease protein|nr:ABC transporter permease subunit [Thermoanaerobaculia bacterium]